MATEECIEHIQNITQGKQPYMLLFYLNPVRSTVWESRSEVWMYTFKVYSALFALLFFAVGFLSIMIAIKRKCHRLKTKTFIAVYTCLAIFGITRGLHLSIDPHGIIGWLVEYFPQWTIISRVLAVLGFPSFSTAYILVFITLYKSADISSSRLWHQDWRVIVPIILVNYTIALIAEVIANSAAYPALLSIVICNIVFSLWGLFICIVYIITGSRLLYKLKHQHVKSMRMSASFDSRKLRQKHSTQSNEDTFYSETSQRRYKKISRTVHKIMIITLFSAIVGIIYALLSLTTLYFTCWFIFADCIGLNGQLSNPKIWLALQIAISVVEGMLVIIMLYSVTDIGGVLKEMFCCCKKVSSNKSSPIYLQEHKPVHASFDSTLSSSPLPPFSFLIPPIPTVPPPPLPSHHRILDINSSTDDLMCEDV